MSDSAFTPSLGAGGVPETALITLYNRACEASRADGLLRDPLATAVMDDLTFPFRERFGAPDQAHAVRARQFDAEVADFLRTHPDATVVALGEGLETQLWRVGDGAGRWVSVDVPEMIDARHRLLPQDPRNILVPGSAWDFSWTSQIGGETRVLIIAQGLLMYFREREVEHLLGELASAFPGGRLIFDTIPSWAVTTTKGHRSASGYRLPAQPWGTGPSGLRALLHRVGIRHWRRIPAPAGRGLFWGRCYPTITRLLPGIAPMVVAADLEGDNRPF